MKIYSLCGHLSSNNLLFAETVLNFQESCGKQLDVITIVDMTNQQVI